MTSVFIELSRFIPILSSLLTLELPGKQPAGKAVTQGNYLFFLKLSNVYKRREKLNCMKAIIEWLLIINKLAFHHCIDE